MEKVITYDILLKVKVINKLQEEYDELYYRNEEYYYISMNKLK